MQIVWSRCPHCHKTLEIAQKAGGPWRSKLGAKTVRPCPKCMKPISDGMEEWDEMDFFSRANEVALMIFSTLILAPILGFVVVAVVMWITGIDMDANPIWVVLGAVAMPAWVGYRSIMEVVESKRRTRGKTSAL
jgi:hypothetical protein